MSETRDPLREATPLPSGMARELIKTERISSERISSLTQKLAARYELGQQVGQGPASVVYKAIDKTTGDAVAIKIVDLPENATVARALEAEARLAAGVDHPLVDKIIGFEYDDADAYFISRFVEGESLYDMARKGTAVPIEAVRKLGQDIAEAVAAIHGTWLLHRNVKSSNVIVRPDGTAVLADLGVGRPTGSPGRLSLANVPAYTAPEVFEGFADARSDVFGIGACLFEALTGRAPPMGYVHTPDGLGPNPKEHRKDAPDDLVDLVRECLARDATKRPATAAEVSARLGRTLTLPGQDSATVSLGRKIILSLVIAGGIGGVIVILFWRYANWYPELFGKVLPWLR
jgi:eukaryotic-like serine/threonine-protein kinase